MKIRGTATDKLADVIQMLTFVHKTGVLTAQREGSEKNLEECSIFFQEGQIVNASVDHLRGADALKKISTWRTCYFVFQAQLPSGGQSQPISQGLLSASQRTPERGFDPTSSMIPYRPQQYLNRIPNFDSLGLSRAHRQLYLLTDGQRSINVLAKLIGRNLQETLALLSDLENRDLLRRS